MTVQNIDFTTSSDYTFNANEIEVTGGSAILKDGISADELIYANFSGTFDLNRYNASKAPFDVSGATAISNVLDLTGGVVHRYASWNADNLDDFNNTGCIRFKYIPNYNGNPSSIQYVLYLDAVTSGLGKIALSIGTSGTIDISLTSSSGAGLVGAAFGTMTAAVGQEYDFEINVDFNSGAFRFFLDGVQSGTTWTTTGNRVVAQESIILGNTNNKSTIVHPNFSIKEFQIFSEPQHTANFTPENSYEAYETTAVSIINNTPVTAAAIDGFYPCVRDETNTSVKYCLNIDGVDKFFNGSVWATSTGSADSNTADTINANLGSLDLSAVVSVLVTSYLLSTDGIYTPMLDSITLSYVGTVPVPGEILECTIRSDFRDSQGDALQGVKVTFVPDAFWYEETYIFEETEAISDANGSIEVSIVETATNQATMDIRIEYESGQVITYKNKTIPNQSTAALVDII